MEKTRGGRMRIPAIACVFALSLSAFGQPFTIAGDSVQCVTAPTKIINNSADSLSIDTVFFKLLPQPYDLQPFSVLVNSIRIMINTEDQYFVFKNLLMKQDSLYYDPDYGKYNPNYPKAQGYLLALRPRDSIQLTGFNVSGSKAGNGDCVLRPSDTNRFALIIFQAGMHRDTLTLMGHFANYIAGVKSRTRISHALILNTYSSQKIYNTLGRRVSSATVPPMQLLLILDKNGNVISRIVGR
jgi:hypothetical protein